MRNLVRIILFLLTLSLPAAAQPGKVPASQKLDELFSRIHQNIPSEEKKAANDSIINLLKPYTASDSLFRSRLKIKSLGQITSPDSLVKIITWNLIGDEFVNSYYLFIVKREEKSGAGKVIWLNGVFHDKAPSLDSVYNTKTWYGALYYDIRPFELNGSKHYAVLGIDFGNQPVARKVIDVITFGINDDLNFGLKCFSSGKEMRNRVVFEYSSKVVMSLKFNGDTQIVFDHLSPQSPQYTGNRQFYGPDLSFDCFALDNGYWRYRADIDIKNK